MSVGTAGPGGRVAVLHLPAEADPLLGATWGDDGRLWIWMARHQPKHLTALEAESEPQRGCPRADNRVNQILSSLVGDIHVRRALLDERPCLLMRPQVEGRIG
jgi:hypothetical protein